MPLSVYAIPENRIVHKTKVDFSFRVVQKPIYIVQYDNKLPIVEVSLYLSDIRYSVPEAFNIRIRWGKRDHTFVYKDILGTNEDRTKVYFEIDEQMTFFEGLHDPIIELSIPRQEETSKAGSSPISINIDRNPVQETDIESEVNILNIDKAVEEIIDARDESLVAIEDERTKALTDIIEEKVNSLESIVTEKTKSVNEIVAEKNQALEDIGNAESGAIGDIAGLKAEVVALRDETVGLKNDTITIKNETSTIKGQTEAIKDETDDLRDETEVLKNQVVDKTNELLSQKGQPGGIATLDEGGKLPIAQMSPTILKWKSTWNAATNTPTITSGDKTQAGNAYIVSIKGTRFGIDWAVEDWLIINSDGVPEKSPNSDAVVSVAGKQGVVTLTPADIIGLEAALLTKISKQTSIQLTTFLATPRDNGFYYYKTSTVQHGIPAGYYYGTVSTHVSTNPNDKWRSIFIIGEEGNGVWSLIINNLGNVYNITKLASEASLSNYINIPMGRPQNVNGLGIDLKNPTQLSHTGPYMASDFINPPRADVGWWFIDLIVHDESYKQIVARSFGSGSGTYETYELKLYPGSSLDWNRLANDSEVIHTYGNELVDGIKTFAKSLTTQENIDFLDSQGIFQIAMGRIGRKPAWYDNSSGKWHYLATNYRQEFGLDFVNGQYSKYTFKIDKTVENAGMLTIKVFGSWNHSNAYGYIEVDFFFAADMGANPPFFNTNGKKVKNIVGPIGDNIYVSEIFIHNNELLFEVVCVSDITAQSNHYTVVTEFYTNTGYKYDPHNPIISVGNRIQIPSRDPNRLEVFPKFENVGSSTLRITW